MDKVLKYGKWIISIVAAIFAVIQFLDFFKVIDFQNLGIKGLFIVGIIVLIGINIKVFLERLQKPDESKKRIEEINKKINNRIGVLKSSEKPEQELIDSMHHITYFERMDILDYSTNDYLSYRVIQGKNESKKNSPYLKYKESTDSKTSSEELVVKAYDIKTGKELSVVFENKTEKIYVHQFKIMFTTPLRAGDEFSIIYFIKIPNELNQLSEYEEMMSVSLNRFEKKIDKLRFGIYLDFIPSQVEVFIRDDEGRAESINDIPIITENDQIVVDYKFNEFYNGAKIKSNVVMDIDKPQKKTYVIHYRK